MSMILHLSDVLAAVQSSLSLIDVALFDKEIVDFACLVDIYLDERSGLRQP